MAQKSSRQYMQELYDLMMDGDGNSSRANKVFDILKGRGLDLGEVIENIESSTGDPIVPKKYKTGGTVSRKRGGKIMQGYKAGGKV